jgi:hypothetical protein
VVDPDTYPAGIAGQVVDAIRDGQRHLRAHAEEAVVLHPHRLAPRAPFPAGRRQLPQLLLLLRIDADHRLAIGLVGLDLLVDVAELRVPVRVLRSLQRLGRPLQAEAVGPQ